MSDTRWTERQGQYLAFIYYYTRVNGRPPAEADIVRFFNVTAPSVHSMIIELERKGFLSRIPHTPRSLRILLPRTEIPDLT